MIQVMVSAPTYDLNSPAEFEALPESSLQEISRRVTRTQTLDLGVAIVDNGFSHGDRTLKIRAQVDEETAGLLFYLTTTYSLLTVSLPEGVFSGVVQNFTNDDGDIALSVLVEECLSED